MARKDIGVGLNRDNRNAINHNFIELYGSVSNIANTITDEVYSQIIDGAKLNWLNPVDSYGELPTDAEKGDTLMTRDNGYVYRFDGEQWIDIQEIDAGPVNELDSRLSAQLAETAKGVNYIRHRSNVTRTNVRPILVITDDDTSTQAYSIMYEQFVKARNIPMTFALISSRVGKQSGSITMEQFYEMKESKNVEFVNHTENHLQLSTLTDEEIESEILNCEKWLNEHGVYTSTLIPPFGAVDERVRTIGLKYTDSILVTDRAVSDINNKLLMTEKVQRVEFSRPLSDITAHLDTAKATNSLMILSCHSHYSQNESNSLNFVPSKLHAVIDYAQANDIEIMKWTDAFQIFKNPIEHYIDDRTKKGVNALGQSIGYGTLDSLIPGDPVSVGITNVSPPSFFPQSQLIKLYIYESKAQEAGFPGAGTLFTSTENNDSYGAQFFLRSSHKSLLYRYWTTNNNWSDWHELLNDNMQLYKIAEWKPSFSSPPGAFPTNTMSLYTVTTAEASSLGWDGAGTLKMFNSPNPGYAHQEWLPYRSNVVKRRYYNNTSNSWSAFES